MIVLSTRMGGSSSPKIACNASFSAPDGPSSAVNAIATTTTGSTKGIVVSARIVDLPRNS